IGPQHANEAPQEDRLWSVFSKECLDTVERCIIEPQVSSVALQKRTTTPPTNPVPNRVANNCGHCRSTNHADNRQPASAGTGRSNQKCGLAGEWYTGAFKENEYGDDDIAISGNELG